MFKRLIIKEWRQFSDIDITFHPHLTVLTGANGAGKTTILNLLADHFGWGSQFVSSYTKDEETGTLKYSNSIHRLGERIKKFFIKKSVEPESIEKYQIGEIQYKNDAIASLILPDSVNQTYSVSFRNRQSIQGLYINSHRPTFPYRAVKSIPTQVMNRGEIYKKYFEFTKTFVFDTFRNSNEVSSTGLIKETIASLAMFGYGNRAVSSNLEAKKLFEDYEEILRIVLPPKLGF
ncbi:AAA family ATPase [Clostridium beijerinckii]|nr:ATP-binding protein [Clostridium beijerinckii]AQS05898.1 DNA replication and repair protein RecF [Clostridium beijerinckii]MBA2912414.1 energy-coupling factor transporter ATP-binding protein EcfA2 [Clostridium beijerinckii]MBC2550874.1 AAA family ATPase [Clostridium beijerinckii]NRV98936.1 energy-coupling factor transporter ATP-binding protein EcfA2 [Clostridium beijerinckii]NRW51675.1 energy-coupling factor transporter ATP-binding protein EcfA2 [Clostridium beijerinckii]